MTHQVILFDLDGTLLTSAGVVSSATATVIRRCKLEGYRIGFITARSRSKKNIRLLDGLPCDFIAFYNGAAIYANNQLIESNVLQYRQTVLMLRRLNTDFPDMVIDVHQEPWLFSSVRGEIQHMDSENREPCNLNNLPKSDIQRIRLKAELLTSIPLQNYMTAESTFYYTRFGDAIIVHKNASKGYAVERASKFFDIPLAQIIAFGDDINDIDMIKNVGTGIAMGNAVSSLKDIADYIIETNDNDGIASWISKYLIKQT